MKRSLALALAAAALAAGCARAPADPPPRHYMRGGMLFPAATGYWLHQYVGRDELGEFLDGVEFACQEVGPRDAKRLRCERGFRLAGGLLSRTDTMEIGFHRNGAIADAEASCRFSFFESQAMSGACAPYAARGAVYPTVEAWGAMAEAMLRAASLRQRLAVYRLPPGAPASLPDLHAALDRLGRWNFRCEVPKHQYSVGFRGKTGEELELVCAQSSLATPAAPPQRQEIVFRYDSTDLAVLAVSARLGDEAIALSPAFLTRRDASVARGSERDRAPGPPTSLTLETTAGERFEVTYNSLGTGSRDATRENFVKLTPESQRSLVQAYLEKQARMSVAGKIPYVAALEWYGPDAVPHLYALVSDEKPELGAAIVKYLCFDSTLRGVQPYADDRVGPAASACIDKRRASMPRSIALIDQSLAENMRTLQGSNARALNAFFDFRRDVIYIYALGPDGKESAVALEETVAGKEGIEPALAQLIQSALVARDRPR